MSPFEKYCDYFTYKTSHMKADANVFLERNTIKNIKMQNRQANM